MNNEKLISSDLPGYAFVSVSGTKLFIAAFLLNNILKFKFGSKI